MGDVAQPGWTRLVTRTGRYEYQFQGRVPAVRNAQYKDAKDYQFLVMDEEGWLYRIPVCLAASAEVELENSSQANTPGPPAPRDRAQVFTPAQIAEVQLRVGLESYRPRQNAPYAELDEYFAVDAARARELLSGAG
jgi:hypothetical protein